MLIEDGKQQYSERNDMFFLRDGFKSGQYMRAIQFFNPFTKVK